MTQEYHISGMTCSSCEAKVKTALEEIKEVTKVIVSKEKASASLATKGKLSLGKVQNALSQFNGKYKVATLNNTLSDKTSSWWETYKPVLLIFIYLFLGTLLIEVNHGKIDAMRWMRHFMAGFFLVFSFFKMLNLKGFKDSYRMYDVIAQKFPIWGYIYAFVELSLGVLFLLNVNPILVNSIALIVMSLSIIGVLKSVLNKKTIQCACLGDIFNLPMSSVTIFEDGLMILMSGAMLYFNV